MMEYVDALGYRISRFTLGTVQLGMKYGIANKTGQPDKGIAKKILSTAFSKGVNVLDTAHNYGESETIISETLSEYPKRDDILVVTKLEPFDAAQCLDSDSIRKRIDESLKGSLEHLRSGCVSFFMLHDPRHMTSCDGEVMRQLLKFRAEGAIKNIGVSVYTSEEADLALLTENISAIQIPFNVFDQRLRRSGFLDRASSKGVVVFARSVFLQGLILMDNADVPEHLQEILPLKKELREICQQAGRPIKEVALKFPLMQEGISSIVVGVDTSEHLEENLACFDSPPLDTETVSSIQSAFKDVPEYLLNPALWHKERK